VSSLPLPMISVIVPSLNEGEGVIETLERVGRAPGVELILADGGSTDDTLELAGSRGARIVSSSPGRALQMNAGSAEARGDILLFLHADTLLPKGFQDQVRRALSQPGVAAGAFRLRFRETRGFLLRLVECTANWRASCLQMPFGDQAIFLTRRTFFEIGGYPQIPLMEDLELIRRLKRKGRILILPSYVKSSARRYQKDGTLKRIIINKLVFFGYFLGVSPEKLSGWYRGLPSGSVPHFSQKVDESDQTPNVKRPEALPPP